MADDDGLERNYPATQKRLEQARAEGQIARSRELATAAIGLAATAGLFLLGPGLMRRSMALFASGLALERGDAFAEGRMLARLTELSLDMLLATAPLALVVTAATAAAPLLLSGWMWSTKGLEPRWSRLDPIQGLKNLVSAQGAAELVKAILKCVLLGAIGTWAVLGAWDDLQSLAQREPKIAVGELGRLIGNATFALVAGLVAIALVDVPFQLWRYYRGLRMTREEVREELRESEGDPQIKARIRSQQREIARQRMMAAVPKADVIVTNPTHFAVALEYKPATMRAPRVVAKGAGLIAQRIRELGAEHAVPTVEAPPLARALFRHSEIGAEIPAALYAVVAQLLAYVYQVQRERMGGGPAPVVPPVLDVPPGLDPAASGSAA